MGSKIYPSFQQFFKLSGTVNEHVAVTRISVNDTTSCYFVLPDGAKDVKELKSTLGATASGFYLTSTAGVDRVVNIDGKSLGTEYVFASRHGDTGSINEG